MNKLARKLFSVILLMTFAALVAEPIAAEEFKTVTDMRGVEVSIPEDPQRVVAISRGLIDTTMYIFGVEDKLVGGSVTSGDYEDYTYAGETYHVCTQISKVINPNYRDLTNVGGFGGPYGTVNVETIASLEPDLLILRDMGDYDEDVIKFLDALERLEIPAVVLKYPNCYDEVEVSTIYVEVRLLGEVFNQQDEAEEIVEHMDAQVQLIRDRTKDIEDEDKPRVLYFGAPSWAADRGGAGYAFGTETIESIFLEDIVNAKNAFDGAATEMISTEHMLALDPDIIILSTYSGYHPPREMYEAERFEKVQDLRVLEEGNVYALSATPVKSERLEFPINLMIEAKALYPDRFEDVDLEGWIRDYFMGLYGVDEEKADELMDSLLLRYLEII
ncbi:MAG: Periplasmic binding protein [Methanothrix harundinacea]|jgi:iron complex transport system substrate-binding protein|uniref:Periplasmic binding protein n=1 Tax=Methanothrix harundinacea TaxID=301375 RepID=A0A101FSD2_9EURY|nr:MAG: Periplasmic binding protein [Methanothrix harundinacea]